MSNYEAFSIPKKIVISRADSIGDVILTLPLAGVLKEHFPDCRVIFLGRGYTGAVIRACRHIDLFVDWDKICGGGSIAGRIAALKALDADVFVNVFPLFDIAYSSWKSGIPVRIGSGRRWFHWFTCNRNVAFSRRKSELHEAQLNLKLLAPLGIRRRFPINEIFKYYGFSRFIPLRAVIKNLLDHERVNLVFHPKSRGSAVEWGVKNFVRLAKLLPFSRYKIFVTGTSDDAAGFFNEIPFDNVNLVDLSGKLSLDELISFIGMSDGVVASSTGPLHIGAAAGKFVAGLFSPRKPIHPGRWAPVGKRASYIVYDDNCLNCKKGLPCRCVENIEPEKVKRVIETAVIRFG